MLGKSPSASNKRRGLGGSRDGEGAAPPGGPEVGGQGGGDREGGGGGEVEEGELIAAGRVADGVDVEAVGAGGDADERVGDVGRVRSRERAVADEGAGGTGQRPAHAVVVRQ